MNETIHTLNVGRAGRNPYSSDSVIQNIIVGVHSLCSCYAFTIERCMVLDLIRI